MKQRYKTESPVRFHEISGLQFLLHGQQVGIPAMFTKLDL